VFTSVSKEVITSIFKVCGKFRTSYRVYNLKCSRTTFTYYSTKMKPETGPPSYNTLPTSPVTLEPR
jgi:hypothetical protein